MLPIWGSRVAFFSFSFPLRYFQQKHPTATLAALEQYAESPTWRCKKGNAGGNSRKMPLCMLGHQQLLHISPLILISNEAATGLTMKYFENSFNVWLWKECPGIDVWHKQAGRTSEILMGCFPGVNVGFTWLHCWETGAGGVGAWAKRLRENTTGWNGCACM